MATVRFSDKLKDEINKKARKMFDKELDKAKADIPSTWNAEYLYNLMFDKDIRDKMNALPKNFMGTTQQITFRGFKNLPQGEYDRFWKADDGLVFNFTSPHRKPHGEDFDDFYNSWRGLTLMYGLPKFATIQGEYKVWREAQTVIMDKRDKFTQGVKQIMNTYSTLGPALKVFPALWDLIPEEYKERHLKITNRKRGDAKELGDLDVDSLTAAVTLNKLIR